MGIILHDVFFNVTDPDPHKMSLFVTMVLERYNVHVVQLGHNVFYANYVCVFIDIDQLKGKPMQHLVKNILCGLT